MVEANVRIGAPDDIDHIKYVVSNGLAQLVVDERVHTIYSVTGVTLDRDTSHSAAYRTMYEPLTLLDRLAGVL